METPLDDYRFDPDFKDKKVKRDFSTLLLEEEEVLWMGKMNRSSSYWLSKGLLAIIAFVISALISAFLCKHAYLGFVEGDFAGKYPRVLGAFSLGLIPWLASYFLFFQRLIYDAKARYAFSEEHVLLYLPAEKKQPYQWQKLLMLGELMYKRNADGTGNITYGVDIPDTSAEGTELIFMPLFEFIENGEAIFEQLVALQDIVVEKENKSWEASASAEDAAPSADQ